MTIWNANGESGSHCRLAADVPAVRLTIAFFAIPNDAGDDPTAFFFTLRVLRIIFSHSAQVKVRQICLEFRGAAYMSVIGAIRNVQFGNLRVRHVWHNYPKASAVRSRG